MNKSELIEAIASKTELSKAGAAKMVDAFVEVVGDEMAKGEKVALVGFGTFLTSKREAREGRNPQTGETIKIAAATVPKFTPGLALKEKVNAKGGKSAKPAAKPAAKAAAKPAKKAK